MKKIRIAAAGDNCMDVYDKENKAFPGGNPVNVAVYVARLGVDDQCDIKYLGFKLCILAVWTKQTENILSS